MKSLLTIAPPTHELPADLLDAQGGFVWWYADAFDQEGNGFVLIWSFGLPFLPGYASAARRGVAPAARRRPSLNLAIYREGRHAFYSLQEFGAEEASWDGDTWLFGGNRLRTTVESGVRSLRADLDIPVPGDPDLRLQGSIALSGAARQGRPHDRYSRLHDWAPLTGPATAHVDLQAGISRYAFSGDAYFDCNGGAVPLHETGIDEWTWGRSALGDTQRIYYVLWGGETRTPEAHGIEIDRSGELEMFHVKLATDVRGRGLAGMSYPRNLTLLRDDRPWLEVQARTIVDDGPFYLRYFTDVTHDGETATGKAEICRPDRIDLARHRPLVKMRVERVGQDNSMWLPLFTGPKSGRVKRLLSQLVGR